jgi:hypothetical protein
VGERGACWFEIDVHRQMTTLHTSGILETLGDKSPLIKYQCEVPKDL